jgi:hypothetical protein
MVNTPRIGIIPASSGLWQVYRAGPEKQGVATYMMMVFLALVANTLVGPENYEQCLTDTSQKSSIEK